MDQQSENIKGRGQERIIPVHCYPVCGTFVIFALLLIERILCEIVGDVLSIVLLPIHGSKSDFGACEGDQVIGGLRIFSLDGSIYIGREAGMGKEGVISA